MNEKHLRILQGVVYGVISIGLLMLCDARVF